MLELENKDLSEVKAGSTVWTVAAIIGVAIVFISGIISGYTNPVKCNIEKGE